MGKKQGKMWRFIGLFLLIPIISFVIGYFFMTSMISFEWDDWFFKQKETPKFNFDPIDNSSKVEQDFEESSPLEREFDIHISEQIEFSDLSLYFIQAGTFATEQSALEKVKNLKSSGFGAFIVHDQVERVYIAAATTEANAKILLSIYGELIEDLSIHYYGLQPLPMPFELHAEQAHINQVIAYTKQLFIETIDFMVQEEISPHSKKALAVFVQTQREGIKLLEKALADIRESPELSAVEKNILQLMSNHEELLRAWEELGVKSRYNRWQGLLEGVFQYPQIVR